VSELLSHLFASDGERYNRVEIFLRELPVAALLALAVVVVIAVAVHAISLRRERRAPRRILIALRVVAALLLLLIVFGPSLELQNATRIPPRVAILVDTSRSMSLASSDGVRLERAVEIAAAAASGLGEPFLVDLYTFAEGLTPLDPDRLSELTATGQRTDIAAAISAVVATDEDGALAGIVLVTDGADTARLETIDDVRRRRPEWGDVPVFPVPVAADDAPDVSVVEVRHDDIGFVRHELSFDAELVTRGGIDGQIQVVLKRDGRPVETRRVGPAADGEPIALEFRVTPDRAGTYVYGVEARPVAGEPIVANNSREFVVKVARDQIRVLMICGRPSWDERFLRQLLKTDPNVDLVSFFILRDERDHPGAPQDELSLIPFPVIELFTTELQNFDVVVLQNFDRKPHLSNLHLENLRRFVLDGGGLLLVGGDLGMARGGYGGSAVEDVLPFRIDPSVGGGVDERRFAPRLTAQGERHFVTRLEPSPDDNRALWDELPELDGTNIVGRLQPDSIALLEHPDLTDDGRAMPILAARAPGRGRVLALTVDSSWYWNFKAVAHGGSNRQYLRFWQNSIRWLTHDPASKFLQVAVAAERLDPGAEQELDIRAYGGDYSPLAGGRIRVRVRPASGGTTRLERDGLTDAAGRFRLRHAEADEGFYRVEAELVDGQGEVVDRDDAVYEVRADRTEIVDPAVRRDLLLAIADATDGRVLSARAAADPPVPERRVYRLVERRRVEVWDEAWLLILLMVVLTGEWLLRRRAGLA